MSADNVQPRRIQRKRTKGWKMPPNTVYVGRPTRWGNPYSASHHDHVHHPDTPIIREYVATPADAVDRYRDYAKSLSSERIRSELRGKNLACFCPLDQPCHADVLLEIANV